MELIIYRNAEEVGRLRIGEGVFSIGRGLHNTVALDDQGVSRRHARIRVEGSKVYAEDLGSVNGTLLRGRPLSQALLADGDVLEIGPFSLRLVIDDDFVDHALERTDAQIDPGRMKAAREEDVGRAEAVVPPSSQVEPRRVEGDAPVSSSPRSSSPASSRQGVLASAGSAQASVEGREGEDDPIASIDLSAVPEFDLAGSLIDDDDDSDEPFRKAEGASKQRDVPRLPGTLDLAGGELAPRDGRLRDNLTSVHSRARLIVRAGDSDEDVYDLAEATVYVGRAREMEITLRDAHVSRRHAALCLEDGTYHIRDLYSLYGVCVNERKVTSAPLRDGDTIRLGNTLLEFREGTLPGPLSLEGEDEEPTLSRLAPLPPASASRYPRALPPKKAYTAPSPVRSASSWPRRFALWGALSSLLIVGVLAALFWDHGREQVASTIEVDDIHLGPRLSPRKRFAVKRSAVRAAADASEGSLSAVDGGSVGVVPRKEALKGEGAAGEGSAHLDDGVSPPLRGKSEVADEGEAGDMPESSSASSGLGRKSPVVEKHEGRHRSNLAGEDAEPSIGGEEPRAAPARSSASRGSDGVEKAGGLPPRSKTSASKKATAATVTNTPRDGGTKGGSPPAAESSRALASMPAKEEMDENVSALLERALTFMSDGRWVDAREALEAAASRAPDNMAVRRRLAIVDAELARQAGLLIQSAEAMVASHRIDDARALYRKVLTIRPRPDDRHHRLAKKALQRLDTP